MYTPFAGYHVELESPKHPLHFLYAAETLREVPSDLRDVGTLIRGSIQILFTEAATDRQDHATADPAHSAPKQLS